MTSPVIEVEGLTRRYGSIEALRGVDLEVAAGEVFAFLGPNGAGKTTTVEILEGYRSRSGGQVRVLGVDPAHPTRAWRERLGIVLQSCALQPELTVAETVSLYAAYFPHPRPVEETIELVGLGDQRGQRAGKLSGGQQRRLDVALAMVGRPELLFLDEPTTGFDPSARRAAWSLIAGLRAFGTTVFLTTHYLEEAEALADRVAIIRTGEIVVEGRADEIGGRGRSGADIRFRLPATTTAEELRSGMAGLSGELRVEDGVVHIHSQALAADLHVVTGWAVNRGLELADLAVTHRSLEDVYLELVQ
ncbi:MAG: ABC transporter ATP-binding protein [Acidimicrobiales bacterium]